MVCAICKSASATLMVWALENGTDERGRLRVDSAGLLFVCAPKVGACHPCAPFDGVGVCSAPIGRDGARFALDRFWGWPPASNHVLTEMAEA